MIKIKNRKILLLPGDGVGPEVVAEVKKIINWLNSKKSLDFMKLLLRLKKLLIGSIQKNL